MTSLAGDIVNRVRRLPKPTSAAESLQPIFEAVSNAMHATEDRFPDGASRLQGRIDIVLEGLADPATLRVRVTDNGIGLGDDRFAAFVTTDTGFKFERGGKGVGRLLWLDMFEAIRVESIFQAADGQLWKRTFNFVLAETDQLQNETLEPIEDGVSGTSVEFEGIREGSYRTKFPERPAVAARFFGSHFLAEFILGNSPQVFLTVDGRDTTFPEGIRALLIEERGVSQFRDEIFGDLSLSHFVFRSAASAGFDGKHQLHFIANGRTVTTRKIDGLVGVGFFGEDGKAVYHGCVSGAFLDERVNQERTNFNFDEKTLELLAKACAERAVQDALRAEVQIYDADRAVTMTDFLAEYPSFGFSEVDELLAKTPKNATKAEQFAQALIPTRIRRDVERKKRVQEIVAEIGEGHNVDGDLAQRIRAAADDVRAEEQRQLTEYVLRRKVVLDVLDVLIRRLRDRPDGEEDYHLEATIHQFICPMRVRGDDARRIDEANHDLWIIDERLTFAQYFASDVPIRDLVAENQNGERPDLLVWDRLHGLGHDNGEPLKRVMLVEFKKPGRTAYNERYLPSNQIMRYLTALKNREVENYRGERVRVADDCIFYCYVIADIEGDLRTYTSGWRTTADGRGRWQELSGDFRGTIEIIEWRDLVTDARMRNAAYIEAAGV